MSRFAAMKSTSPPFLQHKQLVIVLALALVFLIGMVDYATGREITMSPFYLLPIGWVSWVAGRRVGMFLSIASTGVWLVGDLMEIQAYSNRAIPFWNAIMLVVFFAVVVWLLTNVHDANLYLENTVAQRTAALRQEIAERQRLEASKIQSERLSVVGTMAAEMAHEIRNPLGAIVLNLDLIQKEIGKLSESSRHAPDEGGVLIDDMRQEVHRIQQVLEDYLQFSRPRNSLRQPVMLNDLLEKKLSFMLGALKQAGIILHTDLDPAPTSVNGDAEQLWQATLNLVRNAIEAMPNGGKMIVSTWSDGNEARIRVADTGTGMSPEQIQQACVPFFSTKTTGTGLGLALVQQIMIEHGGRVDCESSPGKGSTFTLCLPLRENS